MVPETRLLQRLLPLKKAVTDVLSDFLAYLFACAKKYITESHPNGDSLWQSARNSMKVVLSHPNGWEGLQQSKMRQAAVGAGIVPDIPAGRSRVHFVTEGEASIQYCAALGMGTGTLSVSAIEHLACCEHPRSSATKPDSTVMMVDAGGGTVDISTYRCTSSQPITLEELTRSDCKHGTCFCASEISLTAHAS